jgi:hypothetical protein
VLELLDIEDLLETSRGAVIVVPGPPAAWMAAFAAATPACTNGSVKAALKVWS